MKEGLRSWLYDACNMFTVADELNLISDAERVKLLGAYLFTLPNDCTLSDVRNEILLQVGYEIMGLDDLWVTIEACLICAVSSKNCHQATFVQQIMSMDQKSQSFLMETIQDNLEKYRFCGCNLNTDSLPLQNGLINSEMTSSTSVVQSSQNFDETNSPDSQRAIMEFCKLCKFKEDEIDKLNSELIDALRKEREMDSQLKSDLNMQTTLLRETELLLLDKEDIISSQCKDIEKMQNRINDIQKQIEQHSTLTMEIIQLKDQLDILRPKADRTDAAESQLEKLRERFDELSGIRQQLKQETSMHTETQSRLLEVEQEVESLRKFKTQLEEYRSSYTESMIQIQELSSQLTQKEQEIQNLYKDKHNLVDGQYGQLQQTQRLKDELNETSEQLRGIQRCGGIGEGISELNPALMMELNRLRVENKELLGKLDATSLDSLERLEKHLADQKCMNESLQTKWMNTKDCLADAQMKIQLLTTQLYQLNIDNNTLCMRIQEINEMVKQDQESTSKRHESHIEFIKKRTRDSNFLMATGRMFVLNQFEQCLMETTSSLNQSKSDNDQLNVMNVDLSRSLEDTQDALRSLHKNKIECDEKYQHEIIELNENNKRQLHLVNEESVRNIKAMELKCQRSLDEERANAQALSTELDDERIKRRRVEREKKFQEAEAQRFKTQFQQIQASGAGGGASVSAVEEAMREMRSMQTMLDEANAELFHLRSLRNNTGSSSTSSSSNTGGSLSTADEFGVSTGAAVAVSSSKMSSSVSGSAVRVKAADRAAQNTAFGGYLEHADLVDKRVEQLSKEKRELLAKNLEENKERMELSQKLLLSEKELTTLKTKNTKLTLELERMERKLDIAQEGMTKVIGNDENSVNKTSVPVVNLVSKPRRRFGAL